MAYPTFAKFDDLVKKYGISSSNMYDVSFGKIETNLESFLTKNLLLKYSQDFDQQVYKPAETLRFYTDEISLPGEQVITGNYKINNSPTYSYATDVVYPEMNITFIADAYMNQKKIFEKWIEFIKPIATDSSLRMMRLRYRDEYVSNITIDKYERYGNAYQVKDKKQNIPINKATGASAPNSLLKYSVVLQNAYPVSISSIQLNSGSSQLNRVSVGFKYEYLLQSSNNNRNSPATLENVYSI